MKTSRTLVSWVVIFVAGFISGMIFAAWKLEKTADPSSSTAAVQQPDARQQLKTRIAGLERMLAVKPDNQEALMQLGNDYFDAGRHEDAIKTYEKLLKLDPRNANVTVDMGISYRRLGKLDESLKAFKKALEIDPDHPMALFNLGLVYRDDMKNPREALKIWEAFLEKAGNAPHAIMIRPWVKQLREKVQAENDSGTGKSDTGSQPKE